MSYEIYSDPEKFGLELLGEIELDGGGYSFDLICVWRSLETGALFMAQDSGCSCPSPFERFDRSNLPPLTSVQQLHDMWAEWHADCASHREPYSSAVGQYGRLVERVREALS